MPTTKKDKQVNSLRTGAFAKKKVDAEAIEETTKKVYNKTRKTSLNIDELTFKRLKYIAVDKGVSMKELLIPAIEDTIEKHKKRLPAELR
jgi:predicted DNA-binding ribbon-helix-helix protein